jgi:acyl-CoA thioesterase
MGPSEFERATALTASAEPGVYEARLTREWTIHGGPINGGVTLAIAGAGLSTLLSQRQAHADPFCVSAYYLAAAYPGRASVHAGMLRGGRTMSTGEVSVRQMDGRGRVSERLRALATFGDLAAIGSDVRTVARPPDMPPPHECLDAQRLPRPLLEETELMRRYDVRLDPATAGWLSGTPSGQGQIRAWFRMRDGFEPTPLMLLMVVDALPPVAFDLGISGWVPTLELTVHVRARPAPGWLQIALSSVNFAGGLIEEDAEVWDSSGRLVAQARQLAKVGQPLGQPASRLAG